MRTVGPIMWISATWHPRPLDRVDFFDHKCGRKNLRGLVWMAVALKKSEHEVASALEVLGLNRVQLLEVVSAMVAARSSATQNDPPGAASWDAWRMGTRRIREVLLPLQEAGWERDQTHQVASVVNRKLGVRVVIANTDDGTCRDDRIPQNYSKKGAGTDSLVRQNQTSFLDKLDGAPPAVLRPGRTSASKPIASWYLCVHVYGDEVAAELSKPTDIDDGYFESFDERIEIIARGEDWLNRVSKPKPEDLDDGTAIFDISVRRK